MVDHNDYKESPFTNLCECSTLKIDDYVFIKTHPCRIVEITHSKLGKTGRPKTYVIGLDIFTNKKYEEVFLRCQNVERPIVTIKEYSLLDISYDGFVTLMEDGFIPKEDDLKIPDDCEMTKKMREDFDSGKNLVVSVISAMKTEKIVSYREIKGDN